MRDNEQPQPSIVLYQTEDGQTRIQCGYENETIWLTQALIAELFQITVPTVNEHLKGIFAEGELAGAATIRKFRIVRSEGARQVARDIGHYKEVGQAVEVCLHAQLDTVWLSQQQMADLFKTSSDNVGLHLKKVYKNKKLRYFTTAEDSSVVRREVKRP